MQSIIRIVAGLGLGMVLIGCGPTGNEGMNQIGHYIFETTHDAGEVGFEIREQTGPLARLLELLLGRPAEPRIRVGTSELGTDSVSADSIARVLVRRRVVRGPEAKSPFKRPWEARFVDREDRELGPFFHFRYEEEAERFANEARRLLSSLRTPAGS